MKGVVNWFSTRKGYGFINAEDGNEYFVHITALCNCTEINTGDNVEFTLRDSAKGKLVVNLKLVYD